MGSDHIRLGTKVSKAVGPWKLEKVELLQDRKIATLAELKAALGTGVDMTVFRKLKPLGYDPHGHQR